MKIEILYFDGCPNSEETKTVLRQAAEVEGVRADIVYLVVDDSETAQHLGFLGSPSIRINGVDIEADAGTKSAFGIMCRFYERAGNQAGTPPLELVTNAVREAASASGP